MKKTFLFMAIGMLLTFHNGCAPKEKQWKPVQPRKKSFVHTVKWRGETLQIISAWYTGNSGNWRLLADANPVIDPGNLAAGNKIFIPKHLLKQTKPLTKQYIVTYKQKPPIKKSKKKTAATQKKPKKDKEEEKDEFELFGPK